MRAFAVHPGGIMTPLQRHLPTEEMRRVGLDRRGRQRDRASSRRPSRAPRPRVWAATSPQLDGMGGVYCADCDIADIVDEHPARRRRRDGPRGRPRAGRAPVGGVGGADRGRCVRAGELAEDPRVPVVEEPARVGLPEPRVQLVERGPARSGCPSGTGSEVLAEQRGRTGVASRPRSPCRRCTRLRTSLQAPEGVGRRRRAPRGGGRPRSGCPRARR